MSIENINIGGKPPRHPVHKKYPDGLDDTVYEILTRFDSGEITEETKEMVIREFTDRIRDIQDPETIEFYQKLGDNPMEPYERYLASKEKAVFHETKDFT